MSNEYPGRCGQDRLALARLATSLRITVTVAYVFIVAIWSAGLVVTEMIGHPIGAIVAMYLADIVIFTMIAAWQITWVFRSAAWLEGSTLALRGAFRVKRCDLSVAAVRLDATRRAVPRLNVRDPQARRRMRLPLGRPYDKSIRTPPKLAALADAIMASGRQNPEAGQVAGSLRAWAAEAGRLVGYAR